MFNSFHPPFICHHHHEAITFNLLATSCSQFSHPFFNTNQANISMHSIVIRAAGFSSQETIAHHSHLLKSGPVVTGSQFILPRFIPSGAIRHWFAAIKQAAAANFVQITIHSTWWTKCPLLVLLGTSSTCFTHYTPFGQGSDKFLPWFNILCLQGPTFHKVHPIKIVWPWTSFHFQHYSGLMPHSYNFPHSGVKNNNPF